MNWKDHFDARTLARGRQLYADGMAANPTRRKDTSVWIAKVKDPQAFHVKVELDAGEETLTGASCDCPAGSAGDMCGHIAAVCFALEARLGMDRPRDLSDAPRVGENPWPEEDVRVTVPFPRLAESEEYHYFDLNYITRNMNILSSVCRKGWEMTEAGVVSMDKPPSFFYRDHQFGEGLTGDLDGRARENGGAYRASFRFDKDRIRDFSCDCGAHFPSDRKGPDHSRHSGDICRHGMALLYLLEDYILRNNPGDATDGMAARLLEELERPGAPAVAAQGAGRQTIRLVPRLETDGKAMAVSFRFGTDSLYVLDDIRQFVSDYDKGRKTKIGYATVDCAACGMDEFSDRCYRFIKDVFESERERTRSHQDGLKHSVKIDGMYIRDTIPLVGRYLDEFYEIIRDRQVAFIPRGELAKAMRGGKLTCRDGQAGADLTVEKQLDGRDQFEGVTVSCRVPAFAEGFSACYRVTADHHLERFMKDSVRELLPLCRAADTQGFLKFQVGRSYLPRFYREILPRLEKCGTVTEKDAKEIARYILPEPAFRFYLDAGDDGFICQVTAVYGEKEVNAADLLRRDSADSVPPWRDKIREREILDRVSWYFPVYDDRAGEFHSGGEEDDLFRVLAEGVPEMMELGEVHCTEKFLRLKVRPAARFNVGVSLESGVLDLSVSSGDLTAEEIRDALEAYRQKKKYIRLKNGDLLRTDRDDTLEALGDMMEALQITPKELVAGKMRIPAYRAFYLDRMLEASGITADRDIRFRKLVAGFKAIPDAEFRVPGSLAHVLRGYQTEGYKFLRTLEAYNFGGILADDMGLGKTLQMLAVFLAWKEEGKDLPSLVVCPASLVYNWGEEMERFAPQLEVALVAGAQKERAAMLADYGRYDVLVTSYELLKRDLDRYEGLEFYGQVLDEAQVIKNQTTAAAKSVKLIKSRHRFALTGTPIENRLSELWSIFDFLMPGFLYGYKTFRADIEIPVVKHGDRDVSERLRNMVSPFILRRLKQDVLEDLPGKIEEVAYARAEKKQRSLCDAQAAHIRELLEEEDDEEFNKGRIRALGELTRLREICCDPSLVYEDYDGGSAKREACMELIGQAMDGGHRMLIFSQFTSMLDILEEDLDREGIAYYKITGATPKQERLARVHAFNEGDTPVFLISLKAGGTGLNLTGADVVIHYDPWWNMAAEDQATDRAHRIGQTRVVTEYKLILKDSVEEKILKLQEAKSDLADEILSGDGTGGGLGSLSREDLLELLGV